MVILRLKLIGSLVICGFIVQCMLMIYTVNNDARRSHLKFRHKTTKDVRGPNFHVHQFDLMPINLRENYEMRRTLNEANKPHFIPRRELLSYHRGMNSELQTVAPVQDYLSLRGDDRELNMQCNTCAVVSNSGHMIGSGLGNAIDSADCVFRLNVAPTEGYELDVGRKTSVRVVSHKSLSDLAANETNMLDKIHPTNLIFHGPSFEFTNGNGGKYIKRWTSKYPDTGFYKFSIAAENKADLAFQTHTGSTRSSTGRVFSSGWYTVMLARNVCHETKVYGMTPEDHCKDNSEIDIPYNYYKYDSLPECMMYHYHETIDTGGYRFNTERAIFKSWSAQENLVFLHPQWV